MAVLTVLMVDDEPLVRSGIRFSLEEAALRTSVVGEAQNGTEALEQYHRLLPDVIITDIKMPGMTGLDLIREVRRTDRITQFIMISGYADFEYARQAINHGAAHYVLKPIKTKELEEALKQCAARLEIRYDEALDETERLVRYIEENFSQPLTLEVLSDRFNFNAKYLSRLIKHKVGTGFSEYLLNLRMKRAAELLTKTDMDIKAVALEVGYEDQQYFHRIFKKKTGMTPVQYRRGMDEGKSTENSGTII